MKLFGIPGLISGLFTVAGTVLVFTGFPLYAAIAAVLAFALNGKEIKSYSTFYQFINFRTHTLLLGYATDMYLNQGTYWYTLMMGSMSLVGTLRLEFLHVLLYTRFLWIETLALISWYVFYIWAGLHSGYHWEGWVLCALPLLFMTYIFLNVIAGPMRYTKGPRPNKQQAQIGTEAPGFQLNDINGNPVQLSDFKGKNHVLLIFVRGDWCPSCHIMIRAYENNRDKFAEKNIIPIGISPDSTEVNRSMMERLGWKNMLLSDAKQEIATRYGLLFMNNNAETNYEVGVALPASFLVDKNGVLRYMSRSDRAGEFLSPSLIFPVIDQLA